jgi:hypothetical protein
VRGACHGCLVGQLRGTGEDIAVEMTGLLWSRGRAPRHPHVFGIWKIAAGLGDLLVSGEVLGSGSGSLPRVTTRACRGTCRVRNLSWFFDTV